MEQANEYKTERESYMNIIRHSLAKMPAVGMDYFARRVQVECEKNTPKEDRTRFKLGVGQDRQTCGKYILNNMQYVHNHELSFIAGEMLRRIEDYEQFNLYKRENWKEEGW